MNFKPIIIVVIYCFISCNILCAQNEQKILTLTDLLKAALENDYEIKNHNFDISQGNLDSEILSYNYFPTLSIEALAGYTYENLSLKVPEYTPLPNLLPNFKLFSNPISMKSNSPKIGGALDLKWLIFSGGQIPFLKKALQHKIQAKKFLYASKKENLIIEVTSLYYKISLLNQSKLVLETSKKRLKEESKRVNKAVEVGLAINTDLQKIKVASIKLDTAIIEYENNKKLLFKRLAQLSKYDESDLEKINAKLLPSRFPNKIITNANERPEIKALNESIQAYNYSLKANKTRAVPKIELLGQINYAQTFNSHLSGLVKDVTFESESINLGPNILIGVGIKWDIFDGLIGKIQDQKIKLDIQKAENKKEETLELLTINLEKTKSDYELLTAQVELKNQIIKLTKDILKIETNKYKYGLNTINDRLEAEINVQKAELDYLKTVYDQRIAAINFLKSTNELTVDNVIL